MSIWQAMSGFDGRISRKCFWLAGLVWMIGYTVIFLVLLYWLSGGQWLDERYSQTLQAAKVTSVAALIPYLVGLYPSLAMSIQRLHDLNLSGWWCLPAYAPGFVYFLVPLLGLSSEVLLWGAFAVGVIYLIVLGFIRGTTGTNGYGRDPIAKTPAALVTS